jgi:hypothetical protein
VEPDGGRLAHQADWYFRAHRLSHLHVEEVYVLDDVRGGLARDMTHNDGILVSVRRNYQLIELRRSVRLERALHLVGIHLNRLRFLLVAEDVGRENAITAQVLHLLAKHRPALDVECHLFRSHALSFLSSVE